MTKTKTTKRALFSSVIALALCFAMLLGTTYAWFTDSAASSGNIIKSGTLNIDLGIKTATDVDYVSVKADPTKAAFNYDKWEPGYTEWANAMVSTTGNLALQYKMRVVANGTVSTLANVIDVYYSPTQIALPTAGASRVDTLTGAGLVRVGTLADVISGTVAIEDHLIPDTSLYNGTTVTAASYATLALHMQETAGNEYQNLSIGTDFSIQIIATQYTYESDSFNNQYDAQAAWPQIAQATLSSTSGLNLTTEEVTVSASSVEAANYKLVVDNKNVATETTGTETATTVSYDITLYKNDVKVTSGATYTVEINVGVNKNIISVQHNGADVTNYTYDATTGIITFTTSSFSPFEVVYTDVTTPVATTAVIPSGTITLYGANLDAQGNLDLADAVNNGLISMGTFTLANGVSFTAPATLDANWAGATADFVISFDKNISSMSYNYQGHDFDILPVVPVGKFGDNAGSFWESIRGKWIPCPLASNGYTANTKIALLESVIGSSVSYGELVDAIKEFSCGLVFLQDVGTVTINVDLVLTKDSTSYLAGSQSFTINSANYVTAGN